MQADSVGSWNYSECCSQLTSLATAHGIRIIRINPSQTSHTDPYTNQPVTPSPNRTIRTINGTLDRDYIASMNIARTIKHVRSSPLVKPNKTKHRVTPRKPHSYTRKHISKLIKQIINNVNAGRTPVSATSCATRNALLTHGKHPLTHATQQSPFIIPHSIMNGNNTGYGIDKTILASGPFDDGMKRRNGGFLHG